MPHSSSTPVISAEALTIGYTVRKGAPRVVAGPLQLTLRPGELVCLLGPNGAGKSTLLRTLAGVQAPLGGQLTVGGVPLASLTPEARARQLSIVLTERLDAGPLTVQELVNLGRHPHTGWLGGLSAHDHAQVRAALLATDTAQFAHRLVSELSDGERQKVMLARALAQDTPLILLDEPTAHLDLPNRVVLLRLLHQLARKTGKAILLSTHELDLALQAADQIWLLPANGELLAAPPEDLVLSGDFAAAFQREGLAFDPATGTFELHTPTGPLVQLLGNSSTAFWTRRALLRAGFIPTINPADWRVIIPEVADLASTIWISQVPGMSEQQHDSVATLLQTLKSALVQNKAY
ncbi:MAG: ABC transporter ATP-binding protein [Hymenobacter sp.]|nr:MAG: ABC transporter ATP-binding protein [Hymenobacter sp.]